MPLPETSVVHRSMRGEVSSEAELAAGIRAVVASQGFVRAYADARAAIDVMAEAFDSYWRDL